MRQIVLDTETTGIEVEAGHRIIEIGGVELVNRRLTGKHFHKYINPKREIDDGAFEVHGISQDFLADKPEFGEIWQELVEFLHGAELVIHNAPFDVSFLNYEFSLLPANNTKVEDLCAITDSLAVARHKHPGQKNNLDALCRRYQVDNSQRELHGALLDAEILADVYLLMTGGQTNLFGATTNADARTGVQSGGGSGDHTDLSGVELLIVQASDNELESHEAFLELMREQGTEPLWDSLSA
ncbi:MAG: DNA polymerase III subunit epsilon [Pseudomonadota bacterium]